MVSLKFSSSQAHVNWGRGGYLEGDGLARGPHDALVGQVNLFVCVRERGGGVGDGRRREMEGGCRC